MTTEPKEYSLEVHIPENMKADAKFQLGNLEGAAALGEHKITLSKIFFYEWGTR